jgi:hypothetical protein
LIHAAPSAHAGASSRGGGVLGSETWIGEILGGGEGGGTLVVPATLLDAGDGEQGLLLRRDQYRRVEDSVLHGALDVLAVDQQHRYFSQVVVSLKW